jgi:hypothetical protein
LLNNNTIVTVYRNENIEAILCDKEIEIQKQSDEPSRGCYNIIIQNDGIEQKSKASTSKHFNSLYDGKIDNLCII